MNSQQPADIERQPDHYALQADTFTDEIWHDVMGIYYSTVYRDYEPDRRKFYETAEDALRQADRGGFRFGSRFSMHSKLQVVNEFDGSISFDFSVNSENRDHHVPDTAAGKEVEEVRNAFRGRINDYLLSRNIAIPVYK